MSTFKHFLLTENRAKNIEQDQAIQWIKQNCPQYAHTVYKKGEAPIYRGLEEVDASFLFGDSSKSEPRQSANTTNHYTLLVDNLPEWGEYPPRSQSFICATSINIAVNYDIPYAVFPADRTTIGVAGAQDFWLSFPLIKQLLGTDVNMNEFNTVLQTLIEISSPMAVQPPATWQRLDQQLQQLQQSFNANKIKQRVEQSDDIYTRTMNKQLHALINYTYSKHDGIIIEALSALLDPTRNGFITAPSQRFYTDKEVEVWFSGPAVFVGLDHADPKQIASQVVEQSEKQ